MSVRLQKNELRFSLLKVLFRTDASDYIGTGHVSRCLVLAQKLKSLGAECSFVCREFQGNLVEEIERQGFNVFSLKALKEPQEALTDVKGAQSFATWLGQTNDSDSFETLDAVGSHHFDWCVTDHYGIDVSWEKNIRKIAKKILVIDDLCDRQHDSDILLNQNFGEGFAELYSPLMSRPTKLLLGPKYSLLRDEFRNHRLILNRDFGALKNIFVCMGGVDVKNATSKVIKNLSNIDLEGIKTDVVIGRGHPNRSEIEELCLKFGFVCHLQPFNLVELMCSASLAIGSGGVMSWERCSLGLPTIIVAVADNQIEISEKLVNEKAAIFVGAEWEGAIEQINIHIKNLICNPAKLKSLSNNSKKLVDGLGAKRVSELLV